MPPEDVEMPLWTSNSEHKIINRTNYYLLLGQKIQHTKITMMLYNTSRLLFLLLLVAAGTVCNFAKAFTSFGTANCGGSKNQISFSVSCNSKLQATTATAATAATTTTTTATPTTTSPKKP